MKQTEAIATVENPEEASNKKHVTLEHHYAGLTSEQAAARLKEFGYNEIQKEKPKNIFKIILEVFLEPMFLMLAACLILYFVLGDWTEGIMLAVFVLFVIGLTVYQEKKTENAVHALRKLSSPRALVIRDGETFRVSGRDVVRGDYVVLYEGDRVAADGVILEQVNMSVDESMLTGESEPVSKEEVIGSLEDVEQADVAPPDNEWSTHCVYTGTMVTSGHGIVIIKTTGIETQLGQIGKSLEEVKTEKTPLEKEINMLVLIMLIIGIAAAVAVLFIYGFTRNEEKVWINAILVAVSLTMSLLPEEFPVVLTVFMALGSYRISKKQVLARKNKAIETLGAASVLCTDKTGTLTQNKMELQWLFIPHVIQTTPFDDANPKQEKSRSEQMQLPQAVEDRLKTADFRPKDNANLSSSQLLTPPRRVIQTDLQTRDDFTTTKTTTALHTPTGLRRTRSTSPSYQKMIDQQPLTGSKDRRHSVQMNGYYPGPAKLQRSTSRGKIVPLSPRMVEKKKYGVNRDGTVRYGTHINLMNIVDAHNKELDEDWHELLEYAVLASQRDAFDPMDKAINALARESPELVEHLHDEWEMTREYPLSRKMLALSQVWKRSSGENLAIGAKGAPEAIIDLCHMEEKEREDVMAAVQQMANEGLRVLGVARSEFILEDGDTLPEDQHDFEFIFEGLLGFKDPIRTEVPAAIEECHGAGIKVVMITGDHAATARKIAEQVGIPNETVVLGSQLNDLDDNELAELVMQSCIFARVVPEQKLRIVEMFKRNKLITVMTGDGVNDAPALKSAHIGIAMGGQRGTDVAREAADLVLLDDSFSSIVAACRLGRRIYTNISKAIIYIIAVHIPFAGLSLFPVIFGWPILLYPVHIVLSELIIDPACSVVFEMEPEEPGIFTRPPRPIDKHILNVADTIRCFGQGAVVLSSSVLIFFFNWKYNADPKLNLDMKIGMTFVTLIFSNICLILTNRSKSRSVFASFCVPNKALWIVLPIAFVFLMLCVYVPGLRTIFHSDVIPVGYLFEALGAGLICLVLNELFKGIMFVYKKITRRSPKVNERELHLV